MAIEVRERHVRGVSLFCMDQNVARAWLSLSATQHLSKRDALPAIVEATPSRYAMKVTHDLDLRKFVEFLPGPADGSFDQTIYTEIPALRIETRHRSILKNGPFQREGLSGRKSALLFHLQLELFSFVSTKQHAASPAFQIPSIRVPFRNGR